MFHPDLTCGSTDPSDADSGQSPVSYATTAFDIMLTDKGNMEGRVIAASGEAVANVPIVARDATQNGQCATRFEMKVSTDTAGRFSIGPIPSGVYVVMLSGRIYIVRVWHPGTEPPAARDHAIFRLTDVARAQSPVGAFFQSDRLLLASSIVAAIGIPVAVYANRHDGQPGS
ncbi:MAG: carboxypeptidase regulatory-like domain-containing protein [Pirellulales bacterium]|nr:carboxypeptidase regulatory-like domain-containing protein [Pirellulales bacterium]